MIRKDNFEMPCMNLVTFDSDDVICTSGGGCPENCTKVCTGHCYTVCSSDCQTVGY